MITKPTRNLLPGCPETYEEHNEWIDKANLEKEEYYEPMWRGDCNCKTDFDGPLIRVSSRFYPPMGHYGPGWDGTIHIMFPEEEIIEKKMEADSFEDLVKQTEEFVNGIKEKLKDAIKSCNLAGKEA